MIRELAVVLAVLSGCSAVDRGTLAMLEEVNPLDADPAGYSVMVALPAGLGLQPDGAQLGVRATFRDQTIDEVFTLRQTGLSDGGIAMALSETDVHRLRAVQARIHDWKAEARPGESSGSLSMQVSPCRTALPLDREATLSVSIRTAPDGPLMPLLHPVSAQKAVAQVEKHSRVPVPDCGSVEK